MRSENVVSALFTTPVKKALTSIKENKLWSIYFCTGEESSLIEAFISKAASEHLKGCSDHRNSIEKHDGSESDCDTVLNSIQNLSLFGSLFNADSRGAQRKVIVVKSFHQMKNTEALLKEIEKQSKSEKSWDGDNLLLFTGNIDKRKNIYKYFVKQNYVLEFSKVHEDDLMKYAQSFFVSEGITCTKDSIEWVVHHIDGTLLHLKSELEKIILFLDANSKKTLDVETSKVITGNKSRNQFFDLISAVLTKKKSKALILSSDLIQSKEDALGFVGFVTWALKYPHQFPQLNQNTNLKRKWLDRLISLDKRLKSSSLDARLIIDEFIVSTNNLK